MYPELSRSHLQVLISNGSITVNHKRVKSGYALKTDDRVDLIFPDPQPSHILPENIPLSIVYEDESLLVIDKPAGQVVHPGAGNYSGTVVNALLYHCKNLSGINGIMRPGIVHRLDKNTSGLMVVAKSDRSHVFLARQFETRDIVRTYHALVWGVLKADEGEISTLIDRQVKDRKKMSVSIKKGKKAITTYRIINRYKYFSMLELQLKTGRTHQIRVHLKHIHHPVFGDPEYDGRRSQLGRVSPADRKQILELLNKIDRQALHAHQLSFMHPMTRERNTFTADLPEDFQRILTLLQPA